MIIKKLFKRRFFNTNTYIIGLEAKKGFNAQKAKKVKTENGKLRAKSKGLKGFNAQKAGKADACLMAELQQTITKEL